MMNRTHLVTLPDRRQMMQALATVSSVEHVVAVLHPRLCNLLAGKAVNPVVLVAYIAGAVTQYVKDDCDQAAQATMYNLLRGAVTEYITVLVPDQEQRRMTLDIWLRLQSR